MLPLLAGCQGPQPDHGTTDPADGPLGSATLFDSEDEAPLRLSALHSAARIVRDKGGIAHVRAADEHDLFFLQGWVHAQDRLFQMDVTRRGASGRLAELFGEAALSRDVQMRSFGLFRAAKLSLPLLSERSREALDAYAEGVNAYVGEHPLPPEYSVLEVSRFEPWTPFDSVAVMKVMAFTLAFDFGDVDRTVAFQSYTAALGPKAGSDLFYKDLFRFAPFDPASTVPDAMRFRGGWHNPPGHRGQPTTASGIHPRTMALAAEYGRRIHADSHLSRLANADRGDRLGSNQWVVSGALTDSGNPLLANDAHLDLVAPSVFYPIHLQADPFDAVGNSVAGAPSVVIGHNRHIAWGATVDPFDVTDFYEEQVVADAASPSGLATIYLGKHEPVIAIPESFSANRVGDGVADNVVPVPPNDAIPAATLIVPRRNSGPLVSLDLAQRVGLSVQYAGFTTAREVETFFGFDRAENMDDFVHALSLLDHASLNFCYADTDGNTAYFTNSAVPIREDLEQGVVSGAPPWLIRNGTGGNEWLPPLHPQPDQVVPFEVLPMGEMPSVINPPSGFAVNANNDPDGLMASNDALARQRIGGGMYYLSAAFDGGFRAGRVTARIRDVLKQGKMTFADMKSIQADVKLLDAQVLVPTVRRALQRAHRGDAVAPLAALGVEPSVVEAVKRLSAWDFSTPTGIPEGYDASDVNGQLSEPSQAEIDASVATTIYSVWRGQVIRNVIDAHLGPLPTPPSDLAMTALRNLLDNFSQQHGVGASGIDFFAVPGLTATAEDRRDLLVLKSVSDALALLAGPAFDPAFHGSSRQEDYRWGKLHRVVFSHPMGEPFNVPSAFGFFPAPLSDLPGIPKGGGFAVVDASSHNARAASVNEFMFTLGPSNRLVVELSRGAPRAESVWPGGTSAIPGSPYYLNLLPLWLTNETVPLPFRAGDLARNTVSVERFLP